MSGTQVHGMVVGSPNYKGFEVQKSGQPIFYKEILNCFTRIQLKFTKFSTLRLFYNSSLKGF